jgi:hypothetical protein
VPPTQTTRGEDPESFHHPLSTPCGVPTGVIAVGVVARGPENLRGDQIASLAEHGFIPRASGR